MKKTLDSQMLRALLALAILLALFNLLAFVLPFARTAPFYLAYVFTTVAILLQAPVLWVSFKKGDPKSWLYGFPIARIGGVYLAAQLVAGFLLMAFGKAVPVWLAVVIEAVLLAAAALGLLTTGAMREEIVRQDEALRADVSAMRALQAKAFSLAGQAQDARLQSALKKLSDALRYCDPVSSAATREKEIELTLCVDDVEKALLDGDAQAALDLLKRADALLAERNQLCRLNK